MKKIKTIISKVESDMDNQGHDQEVNNFLDSLNPHSIENIQTNTSGAYTGHSALFLITTTIIYR